MNNMQHSFMIKILNKLETEGNFLNLIKNISKNKKNPIINIRLNYEKLKIILLSSGTRQGCPLYTSFSVPSWKY